MPTSEIIKNVEVTGIVPTLIKQLRADIVDTTSSMGTYVPPPKIGVIEELQTNLLGVVTDYASKLTPESLYESKASTSSQLIALRIINILNEHKKHLITALNIFEEESLREIEMTLFKNIVFEFDYFDIGNDNFRDAIIGLKTVLFSYNTTPFNKDQIQALANIVDNLKNNINLPDGILDQVLNMLDEKFDLAEPMAGVEVIG